MNCNFFKAHKGIIESTNWYHYFFLYFVSFLFSLIFATEVQGVSLEILLFICLYLGLCVCSIAFFLINPYSEYLDIKKKNYPKFTYKMLVDLYNLNPKRIVFSKNNLGFFYKVNGETNYINSNSVVYESAFNSHNYSFLAPKTFMDFLRFRFFVEMLYLQKNNTSKKKKTIDREKKNNEELLAILNVVQSDIDKVMRESQDILNEETEKLERVVSEM